VSLSAAEFIRLLLESGLLNESRAQRLLQRVAELAERSAQDWARELTEQKWITAYQAGILLAGQAGPFHFGNYTLLDHFSEGPLRGLFRARHQPTQYGVLLSFLSGNSTDDLNRWQAREELVEQLSQVQSPFLLSVYEAVVMPDYRFIVSQRPEGLTLEERLPSKARMPWKDACLLMSQVAHAIETLHEHELLAKEVSPSSIWIAKSGFAQYQYPIELAIETEPEKSSSPIRESINEVAGELQISQPSSKAIDWFSFGSCLFRMITGSEFGGTNANRLKTAALAFKEPQQPLELKKFELPGELEQLLLQLLHPDPEKRIAERKVSQYLAALSGKRLSEIKPAASASAAEYKKVIHQFVPGRAARRELSAATIAVVDTSQTAQKPVVSAEDPGFFVIDSARRVDSTNLSAPRSVIRGRKKRKWPSMAITIGAIWIFCGLLAAAAYFAFQQPTPGHSTSVAHNHDRQAPSPDGQPSETEDKDPVDPPAATNVAVENPVLVQRLIPDDRASLWQSPTEGSALNLHELPSNPQIVFVFRPAQLLAQPEGEQLLKSLGPELDAVIENWQTLSGVSLSQIERLIISLHSNERFRYEAFVLCELMTEREATEMLLVWKHPEPQRSSAGQVYFLSQDEARSFLILPDAPRDEDPERSAEPAPGQQIERLRRFAWGPTHLILELAEHAAAPLGSSIAQLARRTDRLRHVNLLFSRSALFNEEGLAFFGGKLQPLIRELQVLLPDEIQGSGVSLHLDQGTYFEIQFLRTVDIKVAQLHPLLVERFRGLRNRLTEPLATIPPSPYWDRVRARFQLMLVDFFRSLRWGVENGEVTANSWLPPMAAHNLIAATELGLSFSAGTSAIPVSSSTSKTSTAPQSLQDVLNLKRDLIIANPPDLNLLMSDLEKEIHEEHPGLPFQFKIRLIGPDLQLEGITQNQRPGELNIRQKSLHDLLTEIMVSANPAKDIAGPADPRCKLVWAIADDPEQNGRSMIVITTRSAAKQKNYRLPEVFGKE
jgi:serine/threonine protein kinase